MNFFCLSKILHGFVNIYYYGSSLGTAYFFSYSSNILGYLAISLGYYSKLIFDYSLENATYEPSSYLFSWSLFDVLALTFCVVLNYAVFFSAIYFSDFLRGAGYPKTYYFVLHCN